MWYTVSVSKIYSEDQGELLTMKTLYVSDLDGTLLQSSEKTSDYTNNVINRLVGQGMLFSYATARSYHTSHKVTEGLTANFPLITYNGAVITGPDGSVLWKNFFTSDIRDVLYDLFQHGIFPIVYAFREDEEKFSYVRAKSTDGIKKFVDSRKDTRNHPVENEYGLLDGEIFYITCIGKKDTLMPFYSKYKHKYHCVFYKDIYSKEQWLEIMPAGTSKANAVNQLKTQLGCGRVVVFGDGKNDIELFQMADESYAVANAVQELKDIATDVIMSNDNDGVAKWLAEHVLQSDTGNKKKEGKLDTEENLCVLEM